MDFAQYQRNPNRHWVGIVGVVILHIIIIYALMTGLARKVVEVVKGPLDVKVIEEAIKKPPPPPDIPPPPPKLAAPPPPFIPPPEVNIAPPPPVPTIAAVTQEAPPAPVAPAIQKTPEETTPVPASTSARAYCPNHREVSASTPYPREAQLEGIEGTVTAAFTIAANGTIRNPTIQSSSNRVFNRTVLAAVSSRLKCDPPGRDTQVTMDFVFKLK